MNWEKMYLDYRDQDIKPIKLIGRRAKNRKQGVDSPVTIDYHVHLPIPLSVPISSMMAAS